MNKWEIVWSKHWHFFYTFYENEEIRSQKALNLPIDQTCIVVEIKLLYFYNKKFENSKHFAQILTKLFSNPPEYFHYFSLLLHIINIFVEIMFIVPIPRLRG